jgi:UDP-N-acetylglucosamine acyltransferase
MEGARIGENCRIFPGAVISGIPQDLKFEGEKSLAIIGNNTTIRECATINRGTSVTGKTEVGEDCLIMAYSHIAHDCKIGNNCIIVNSVALGGHVTIGDYAIIGGLSAVHQFASIGKHAMVSGGSLIRKDVPPYVKAAREPSSFVGINSIGLRRRGFSDDKIKEIQNIFRILYQNNNNNTQALLKIETEIDASPERDEIISFIQNSGRGIMKGFNQK